MTPYTPLQVINIAKICQVLAINDRGNQDATKGGYIDDRLPRMLYMERKALEWAYNTNAPSQVLQQIANYVFALCFPYTVRAIQIISSSITKPIIVGPFDQSVTVGQTATFSVTVTGGGPYTYQWFLNGISIPGATGSVYLKTNAQLTDSGGIYFVQVTNAAGTTSSVSAVLTVITALTGYLYYSSSDPGPTLQSNSDPFTYQINYIIANGQPIPIPLTVASASNQFIVAKIPTGQPIKTIWFNTPLNNGVIPDFVFAPRLSFGGYDYYYTKQLASFDPTQPLILS